ncbi:MAG: hypothetical protein JWQ07_5389 [Ramlibacter sp.]|nr:hypothetical protein [Ramlibacter sp.]
MAWHLITGEYPPQSGGIADYTQLVAGGLAKAGAEVHVWAPQVDGPPPEVEGVVVHRVAKGWSRDDLASISAAINACPGPRRLVVQYATNPWGRRGANLGFCRWLGSRRRAGDDVWAMVHEGFYSYHRGDPLRYLVLAAAHRIMIRDLLKASSRAYYSMPYWEPLLRRYEPSPRRPISWLPVPSNVPVVDDPEGVAEVRARVGKGRAIIGNFGTFGKDLRGLLRRVLPPLLEGRDDRVVLLIGRNGGPFADELIASHPHFAGQLIATGSLPAEDTSRHLQACDVMLQPYEYGVSTRRGTVMADLAHARPIATTFGNVTEPLWAETGCVAGVDVADLGALADLTESLLGDPDARARLGSTASDIYERRFAVDRTVEAMLRDSEADGEAGIARSLRGAIPSETP